LRELDHQHHVTGQIEEVLDDGFVLLEGQQTLPFLWLQLERLLDERAHEIQPEVGSLVDLDRLHRGLSFDKLIELCNVNSIEKFPFTRRCVTQKTFSLS
jgi:hypothetical protein